MENLRFRSEEQSPTDEFIEFTNNFCDIYVNDAFATSHRNHSSITGFPGKETYYGHIVQQEVDILNHVLYASDKKKLAIIGGSKIKTKLTLLKELCKTMDTIYICGGNINSLNKENYTKYLNDISLHRAKIMLMEDGALSCLESLDQYHYCSTQTTLQEDEYFFDMGEDSIAQLASLIQDHELIFWNGVCGMVENPAFAKSSHTLLSILEDA